MLEWDSLLQGQGALGPVFGALQPIPFGTVPLGAYQHVTVPQMPAGSYVPGPSQHTLHPNAPQFVSTLTHAPVSEPASCHHASALRSSIKEYKDTL